MWELIFTIILLLSVGGIFVIIWHKIPVLVQLPEKIENQKKTTIFNNFKNNLIKIHSFQNLIFNTILQKFLSKTRILILKLENKTFFWLQKLREESQKKKLKKENYWQELKKKIKK